MEQIENELKRHKFIVFAVEHYNTLGAIRSLGEKGISPILILNRMGHPCPHMAPNSKYLSEKYIVEDVEEGFNLLMNKFGNEKYKPFIISCDDWVENYLDENYDILKDKFYFFDGGVSNIITRYQDKEEISKLAVKHGCRVPKSENLKKGVYPKTLQYPVITKALRSIAGAWKKDVRICYSREELEEAYRTIESEDLLVEEFIEKKNELCLDGFSINHGKDICIPFQSTYIRVAPGKFGNYMTLEPFKNEVVLNQVQQILQESRFNGVFSVEYLIDKNDELYFLEVNFRNSTWSYAFTCGGVNLVYEWAKSTLLGKIEDATRNNARKTPFKALVEFNDFRDFVVSRKVSIFKWIYDFITADCVFYWNKKDPRPFLAHMKYLIKKAFRSILRKS